MRLGAHMFKFQKFSDYYLSKFVPLLIALIIGLFSGIILHCITFYLHEGGHITFGYIDNIVYEGKLPSINITNYMSCPIFYFLKMPQQTMIIEGKVSLLFIYGGIMAVLLVSSLFSIVLIRKTRHKAYMLFPLIFAIHEILGNSICGTDNIMGKPYAICETNHMLNGIITWSPFLLTVPITFLIFPHVQKKMKILFNWIISQLKA